MPKERTAKDDIKRLRKLIRDIRIAMLTTVAQDGALRSRPMATADVEFDGDLWFFTRARAPKAEELMDDQRVNVSFADHDENRYVSVSGRATLVRDRDRVRALWSRFHKAWFPEGKNDPDLALIKITVDRAEYWDGPASKMVHLAWLSRASLTGEGAVLSAQERRDESAAEEQKASTAEEQKVRPGGAQG
ncbi:MAG TPA: pyridoxamine 5'-phosphate oxidase family protein [Vicinamibacteria bacterium]|jgi:general stress protein 26